ncbi:MAG: bifunctional (p)ppGpp synthetase/guanosine-3',5'-bis(diphosphate) 3'-pyrophosphohydrolase [Atopobiaceae bacterium]|nr:bifunctional (p)ppGpp synthetase/guanosine-3',5'-bis(diphosphate) 3'-pyrophosphohydrolase [Atopobiaceae bacterium]
MDENNLFGQATAFAAVAHAGQLRKGTSLPYLLHPMEAATICASMTDDEEVLAAAVLHDTLEDTHTTAELLEERFGSRVTELVRAQTENKRKGESASATWKTRKRESLEHLRATNDHQARMIYLSDKLSNIRSTARDLERTGERFWERFNQRDPLEHAWYYLGVADILEHDFANTPAWQEYHRTVHQVFDRYLANRS